MEHRLKAVEALEADGRGAEALELLRQGESLHGWDADYLLMVLRLVCLFGSCEEARLRMEELRERGPSIELFMQADEDFLPAWNTSPAWPLQRTAIKTNRPANGVIRRG